MIVIDEEKYKKLCDAIVDAHDLLRDQIGEFGEDGVLSTTISAYDQLKVAFKQMDDIDFDMKPKNDLRFILEVARDFTDNWEEVDEGTFHEMFAKSYDYIDDGFQVRITACRYHDDGDEEEIEQNPENTDDEVTLRTDDDTIDKVKELMKE